MTTIAMIVIAMRVLAIIVMSIIVIAIIVIAISLLGKRAKAMIVIAIIAKVFEVVVAATVAGRNNFEL